MGSNLSWINGDRTADGGGNYGTNLSRPVESLSWYGATNYCGQLTQRERAAGRIATNCVYRLPTEAEWEYACRAWTSDRRASYGDDPGYTNLINYAWNADNSGFTTHPVGQKLPNLWGLYDVYGNVFEWCQDWYGDYLGGIVLDPQGPTRGSTRVIRGGDFGSDVWLCRSASRIDDSPDDRFSMVGFRVVLAPGGNGGTAGNCDPVGKPDVLTLIYPGHSCTQAQNAQMAIPGKTSCTETAGGPNGAPSVRVVASDSSTPPVNPADTFFDGSVALNQSFEVAGELGSNTYFQVYVGNTLAQTIQIHTSCSAPLIRGDTFGSLMLMDYQIVP